MNTKHCQTGLSLVELMITMVIGLIVIGASLSIFVGTVSANADQIKMAKVNTELRNAMLYITRDLRRANYQNFTTAEIGSANFPGDRLASITGPLIDISGDSIEVQYDLNSDGAKTETFGYKLDGNVLKTRTSAGGAYAAFTDSNNIKITALSITNRSPVDIPSTYTTNRSSQVPLYEIVITGEYPSDDTYRATLRETVRPRNPIVIDTTP